jgi:hypothetical protein
MIDAIISVSDKFYISNVRDGYSNQDQFRVLPAIQMGMLNASGVGVQGSSFLAITCSAKFLPEIPLVLFVLERYVKMFANRLMFKYRQVEAHANMYVPFCIFDFFFQGSMCCSDCKGTGFRARWLGKPPISK